MIGGDPTVLAWSITAAYLATAALCFRRARLEPSPRSGPWWLVASATLLLGLNKELDLQTVLIGFGRSAAMAEGWYGARRVVQFSFLVLLFLGTAVAGGAFLRKHLRFFFEHPLLGSGALLAVCYALLRASQFNHLGDWAPFGTPRVYALELLESAAALLLLSGALRAVFAAGTADIGDVHRHPTPNRN